MRVAVIGCGSAGRRHVRNLKTLGADVSVYDTIEHRIWDTAAELGVAMCGGNPYERADAVVIATPWNTHLEFVERAIRERKPFFVEKPLGSLEQLPQWRELAKTDLPVNQVGYQCRFHEKAKALRQLFPKPSGGQFFCVTDMRTWVGRSYGPFLLEASHELDLMLWLGATTDSVQAGSDSDGQYIDLSSWRLRSKQAWPYRRQWQVWDANGCAMFGFDSPEELGDQMYLDEMAHFLECVREQKPTMCPLADGLRVLDVVAQVEQMTTT